MKKLEALSFFCRAIAIVLFVRFVGDFPGMIEALRNDHSVEEIWTVTFYSLSCLGAVAIFWFRSDAAARELSEISQDAYLELSAGRQDWRAGAYLILGSAILVAGFLEVYFWSLIVLESDPGFEPTLSGDIKRFAGVVSLLVQLGSAIFLIRFTSRFPYSG
jgi:hypothetical protein